jgi:hypothetical protein
MDGASNSDDGGGKMYAQPDQNAVTRDQTDGNIDSDIAAYLEMLQNESEPATPLRPSQPMIQPFHNSPNISFQTGRNLIPLVSPLPATQDHSSGINSSPHEPTIVKRLPLIGGGSFLPEELFITCCNPGIELIRIQSYDGQDSYMQRIRDCLAKQLPFFKYQNYLLIASRVKSSLDRSILYNKTASQKDGQKYPRVFLVRRVNQSCHNSRHACLLRLANVSFVFVELTLKQPH